MRFWSVILSSIKHLFQRLGFRTDAEGVSDPSKSPSRDNDGNDKADDIAYSAPNTMSDAAASVSYKFFFNIFDALIKELQFFFERVIFFFHEDSILKKRLREKALKFQFRYFSIYAGISEQLQSRLRGRCRRSECRFLCEDPARFWEKDRESGLSRNPFHFASTHGWNR